MLIEAHSPPLTGDQKLRDVAIPLIGPDEDTSNIPRAMCVHRRATPPGKLAAAESTAGAARPSSQRASRASTRWKRLHVAVCVTCASAAIGLMFQRKLLTAPLTWPCSIRNTPSLVSPVSSADCGSTVRMYQKQVTSRARSVCAIISPVAFPTVSNGVNVLNQAFGGYTGGDSNNLLDDTWVWDGSSWTGMVSGMTWARPRVMAPPRTPSGFP